MMGGQGDPKAADRRRALFLRSLRAADRRRGSFLGDLRAADRRRGAFLESLRAADRRRELFLKGLGVVRSRCALAIAGLLLGLAATGCSREAAKEVPVSTETTVRETKKEAETESQKPTDPIPTVIEPFPDAETQAVMEVEPGLKILIATDIHYLARELTDKGSAFTYMVEHGDGKVTHHIWEIMEAFTQEVIRERPDLLIVSGDMSLNGELLSHREFAGYLERIEEAKIPVAVIPGNHDIQNPGASRYQGEECLPAERTSPEQFYQIYRRFGYDEAISRDRESLSYVYPISDKVWGLMLDSCQYEDGQNLVGGMVDMETYDWIEEQLDKAAQAQVMLLPVSHHNLLDESQIYEEDCTIEHSERLIELLVGWGAPLYVSGHLHVQHYMNSDPNDGGETGIYEVVTSSLATPPCQYGVLSFQEDGQFHYHTQILDMDTWSRASGQTDIQLLGFSDYRTPFLEHVFYNQAHDQLEKMPELGLSLWEMDRMSQVYAKANCYYYWGRAVEIAPLIKESKEYELWSELAAGSLQADYLEYILEEAVRDYNDLKWEKE